MEDLGQIEFMEEAEAVNGLDALSVSAQADDDGFVIEDGVLTKYTGTDTEVVVPDGVTSIARFAFHGCSSLTDITLPSSVTIIGDYAFDGCSSLTDITLPSSVTIIGDYAFDGC
ncbi:MAG: leucine-rich repeat domain-containing protein, partial [Lachnospiraceae bacterium]|nr:leucine-rich repeat domain-containing protein [Lachnospiraceae bacterium]